MKNLDQIKTIIKKHQPKNLAADAIYLAIEEAERYGTTLAIKRDGKGKFVTPTQMKRILKTSK